jgi:hypothetical protein
MALEEVDEVHSSNSVKIGLNKNWCLQIFILFFDD